MHDTRDNLCFKAVQEVFKQIPTVTERPHQGKLAQATDATLPLLEYIFSMPSSGPAVGCAEWLQQKKDDITSASFQEMNRFPQLLRVFVKYVLRTFCVHGKLKLRPGEVVPSGTYKKDTVQRGTVLKETRRHMHPHSSFTFLRSGGVVYAFERLRDLGYFPQKMHPDTLPKSLGKSWSNFGKIRVVFYVLYCYAQGLTMTNDVARQVLIYVFLGKALMRSEPVDIMVAMHKRLQTGLHRFTHLDSITVAWAELFSMLTRTPKLQTLLDDKGEGSAPKAYVTTVERCLRKYAFQKQTPFGAYAMESYKTWTEVAFWKKREAYIAAVRAFKGLGSYYKYIAYNWEDHVFRLRVGKTFRLRHFQYSNGSCRLKLEDPPAWSLPPRRRRSSYKKVSQSAEVEEEDSASQEGEEEASGPDQEWDSEEGEFVSV